MCVKKDGIATTLSTPPKILAIIDERLLFFDRSSISRKPKALEHSMLRSDVASVELDPKKATNGLIIRFSDDSVYFDAPKIGNDANPFAGWPTDMPRCDLVLSEYGNAGIG